MQQTEHTGDKDLLAKREIKKRNDYRNIVNSFVEKLGGKIARDFFPAKGTDRSFDLELGTEIIDDMDNERTVEVSIRVGNYHEVLKEEVVKRWFDDNEGIWRERTSLSWPIRVFRFKSELSQYFDQLVSLIPQTEFFRIIRGDDWLEINLYPNLSAEEKTQLQEQAQPTPDGVVPFSQGEWVLVDGQDMSHKIATLGAYSGGCRYLLVYDPVLKRAAASHFDLVYDLQVAQEMIGELTMTGSSKKDLKIFGSSNIPSIAKHNIKSEFPTVSFDLNDDFLFDVRTGELVYLNKQLHNEMAIPDDFYDRAGEKFPIREKNNIPHVRVYKSQSL